MKRNLLIIIVGAVLVVIFALLLFVYLFAAMIWPERF